MRRGALRYRHLIDVKPIPGFDSIELRDGWIRVRAAGTIGGNLCFAEPHSDPTTLLLALNAKVETEGPGGRRIFSIGELINGAYSNSLEPGELMTALCLPVAPANQLAAYLKFQIRERPTLGLALVLETSGSGIEKAAVSLGCVCPFPRRSAAAEVLLVGPADEARSRLATAAALIAEEAELIDDHQGGADYKAHLIGVFLKRAFAAVTAPLS